LPDFSASRKASVENSSKLETKKGQKDMGVFALKIVGKKNY
jgi:hypothetical protein